MVGASNWRILRRHLLPHLAPILLVWGAVAVNLAVALRGGTPGGATLIDFRIALLVTAVVALGSVLWYLPLEKSVGDHVSGRRHG